MRSPKIISLVILTAISFSMSSPMLHAQIPNQPAGNPGMGMILFPVQRGANGQQYIITRAGYQIAADKMMMGKPPAALPHKLTKADKIVQEHVDSNANETAMLVVLPADC